MTNGDLVKHNGDALVEDARKLEGTLTERIGQSLPAVIDVDGQVDWAAFKALEIPRDVGQLAVAFTISDLMLDQATRVQEYEERGNISAAVREYMQSKQMSTMAPGVLRQASEMLFDDQLEPRNGGHFRRSADGDVTINGETLMSLGDVLITRLQHERIDSLELQNEFIEKVTRPTVYLVRLGYEADKALAIVDAFGDTPELELDDVLDAAEIYQIDLTEDHELINLKSLTDRLFAEGYGLESLVEFVDHTGTLVFKLDDEIDAEDVSTKGKTVWDLALQSNEDYLDEGKDEHKQQLDKLSEDLAKSGFEIVESNSDPVYDELNKSEDTSILDEDDEIDHQV